MSARLLLDEHYAREIAERLRASSQDVIAVLEDPHLRAQPDAELFRWAGDARRRIVTENVKDVRPLLMSAYMNREAVAPLLLVNPRRFPRGTGGRAQAIVKALTDWLEQPDVQNRPDEDWIA